MFVINGISKFAEQDDFENGCIGNSSDSYIEVTLKSATREDSIAQFASFVGVKAEDVETDVCEEVGRIECGKMENAEGYEASENELAGFREGNTVLFYAVYTAYVMACEPVSMVA